MQDGVHASDMGNEDTDSDEEFDNFMLTQFMDDSADMSFIYGTFQLAMHVDKYCSRSENHP